MKRVGLIGVSSHSFRRTALTQMSNNGTPLRMIQEVSGHRNLEQLQVYIEVRDDQVLGAVTGVSMLSPVTDSGKYGYTGMFSTVTFSQILQKQLKRLGESNQPRGSNNYSSWLATLIVRFCGVRTTFLLMKHNWTYVL